MKDTQIHWNNTTLAGGAKGHVIKQGQKGNDRCQHQVSMTSRQNVMDQKPFSRFVNTYSSLDLVYQYSVALFLKILRHRAEWTVTGSINIESHVELESSLGNAGHIKGGFTFSFLRRLIC